MTIESRVGEARCGVVCDLEEKAAYRESLADRYPWDAGKNGSYAESIRLAAEFVSGLPDDDPSLLALARCEAMWPKWSGEFALPSGVDGMPSRASGEAIHCGPRGAVIDGAEIAAWFAGWVEGAVAEAEEEAEAQAEEEEDDEEEDDEEDEEEAEAGT